ncbi:hypothetical protein M426DRAFT_14174 [Hypoxylon sp. CI-4A]|nr:hypothetical protein M426DRAFT_14174 [Hypoxylon sp. CI-4A]
MPVQKIVKIVGDVLDVADQAMGMLDGREVPRLHAHAHAHAHARARHAHSHTSHPIWARNTTHHSAAAPSPPTNFSMEAGFCGIPQFNFDMCRDALKTVTIQKTAPGERDLQFDNIPPTCMVLSTALAGVCDPSSNGASPTPCGSACLLYANLSDEDMDTINNALAGK